MSLPQPPFSHPTGQYPQQPTPYPYPYHPSTPGQYGQTPTTYPALYQPSGTYGTTGVTGYGQWPYQYAYAPQQQHMYAPRPPVAVPSTATPSQPPRSATFTAYTPSYASNYKKETVTAAATGGTTGRSARKQQANFKGVFAKELKNLMYGFGDDRNPANDTVNVMEEILVEYIVDVCQTSGGPSRKSRLSVEDLRRVLSRPADAKKLARMEELLFMQEDIKRARAEFEASDINQTRAF